MDDRGIYSHVFSVPEAAIDVNGHVNNLEYLRWMQEVAKAHSDAQGWTLDRYEETRTSWVVRSHAIDYLRPAFAGERLTVLTWISSFEERESMRHCLFWRERDRKVLARARTLWVFVNAATGRARSIPEEVRSSFDAVADEAEVVRRLKEPGVQTHLLG